MGCGAPRTTIIRATAARKAAAGGGAGSRSRHRQTRVLKLLLLWSPQVLSTQTEVESYRLLRENNYFIPAVQEKIRLLEAVLNIALAGKSRDQSLKKKEEMEFFFQCKFCFKMAVYSSVRKGE